MNQSLVQNNIYSEQRILIDTELIQWLQKLKIIKDVQKHQLKSTINQQFEVSSPLSNQFLNGIIFTKIIGHINHGRSNLTRIKDTNSQMQIMNNWNLLQTVFKKDIGIQLDADFKQLIVSGDVMILNDFLQEIYQHCLKNNIGKSSANNENSHSKTNNTTATPQSKNIQSNSYQITIDNNLNTVQNTNTTENRKDTLIDIKQLNTNKHLNQTDNLLEFLILCISKNLGLKNIQSTSLLTKNSKYLAHVIVKGIKHDFEPIKQFYNDFQNNLQHIVSLYLKDVSQNNLNFIFMSLQAGFVSKDQQTALICNQFFQQLYYDLVDNNLITDGFSWFFQEDGGCNMCLLGIKRHQSLISKYIMTIQYYGKYHLYDIFTRNLLNQINVNEQFIFLRRLFQFLDQSQLDEFQSLGIIDFWISYAYEYFFTKEDQKVSGSTDKNNKANEFISNDSGSQITENTRSNRNVVLGLLIDIFILYPNKVEQFQKITEQIIMYLKQQVSSKQNIQKIVVLTYLFRLLEKYGRIHSNIAPYLYKTLSLIFIENYDNSELRGFILNNFGQIFESIQSIPLEIFLDPYIKNLLQQINNNSQTLNIFDFEFIFYVSSSNKIQVKSCLELLEILNRIFLNSVMYSSAVAKSMLVMMIKNIDQSSVQKLIVKFIKQCLAVYFSLEKKKKKEKKDMQMYNMKKNRTGEHYSRLDEQQEQEQEIINGQKRNQILEIINRIIKMDNDDINLKIKILVAHTTIQIKNQKMIESKGLNSILENFGDPQQIVSGYEQQFNEQQKNESESNKQTEDDCNRNVQLQEQDDKKQNKMSSMKSIQYLRDQKVSNIIHRPKADPKILNTLQQINNQNRERQISKQKEQQQLKEKEQQQKKSLRKQLEKRSFEQGVLVKNKSQKDCFIFEWESQQNINKDKEFQYMEIEQMEQRDQEIIKLLLNKYSKKLRLVFNKYQKKNISKSSTFEQHVQQNDILSNIELLNFMKEKINSQIYNLEQTMQIIKVVNYRNNDRYGMSFNGFMETVVQLAMQKKCYIKDEKFDNRTEELGQSVQKYLEKLCQDVQDQSQNQVRVTINYSYSLPDSLCGQLGGSYQIVNQILDGLLQSRFQISINQSMFQLKDNIRFESNRQNKFQQQYRKQKDQKNQFRNINREVQELDLKNKSVQEMSQSILLLIVRCIEESEQ